MAGQRLPSLHPAALLATWFGAGLLPWAPGTWGSLAALPFAWAIATLLGPAALVVAAAIMFVIGWWAAARVGRASGIADEGSIVIDEVAGQWLTLAVVRPSPATYLLGFLLFRLFDITKPWPARTAERTIPGGLGVMADDIVAGIYAAVLLYVLHEIGRALFGL
ncbi:MAG TPA: phosphatidylglycerophosphatase A [Stellaceae bacterium]|nr:phosphatidylglycerophosphatase A [Stellaceae bacterium]